MLEQLKSNGPWTIQRVVKGEYISTGCIARCLSSYTLKDDGPEVRFDVDQQPHQQFADLHFYIEPGHDMDFVTQCIKDPEFACASCTGFIRRHEQSWEAVDAILRKYAEKGITKLSLMTPAPAFIFAYSMQRAADKVAQELTPRNICDRPVTRSLVTFRGVGTKDFSLTDSVGYTVSYYYDDCIHFSVRLLPQFTKEDLKKAEEALQGDALYQNTVRFIEQSR